MSSKVESRDATIIIGWYTFLLHFLSAFYFVDVYGGSNSDAVISPLFEYSEETMRSVALLLAIYSIIYMTTGALGLIRGVRTVSLI